jgi:NAD+ synthase (glutamine-hydrolysing)
MKNGFLRVAVCTPALRVADPENNAENIYACLLEAVEKKVSMVVFPELSLTGYTCSDLFFQKKLQEKAIDALLYLIDKSKSLPVLFAVGLPLAYKNKLYNCAAIICGGVLLGIVPKTHLPNYGEFYEQRHFSSGPENGIILIRQKEYPFGTDQIFTCREFPEMRVGIEICEDLWIPIPPSSRHAMMGATILANLSASDETISKAAYRRSLVSSQSARLVAAYLYADAGFGESTTDMVFAGHNLIAENGRILAESPLFSSGITFQDIDLQLLVQERIHQSTYPNFPEKIDRESYRETYFSLSFSDTSTIRSISPYPFVPSDTAERDRRCEEILAIQSTGLAQRLSHTRIKNVVIGMSGGLDSTLAYLVTIRAFNLLSLPLSGIQAITMPGFGTTSRTHDNACNLSRALGTGFKEISIVESVTSHFKDIGHDPNVFDVTYENGQARERTQILMDLANQNNGLVIGTGDLSELALGWATYNGDHMSMYAVNSSVPKTLVRYLVSYSASISDPNVAKVLLDVLDTPVSPELLPHSNDRICQVTEDLVGPYALHDFFLYYFMRYGFTPEKLLDMAIIAFDGTYDYGTIKKWLKVFISRFFSQQFKRSCLPDGPKVGSVTLSPRADWRMPSDACSNAWLESL